MGRPAQAAAESTPRTLIPRGRKHLVWTVTSHLLLSPRISYGATFLYANLMCSMFGAQLDKQIRRALVGSSRPLKLLILAKTGVCPAAIVHAVCPYAFLRPFGPFFPPGNERCR